MTCCSESTRMGAMDYPYSAGLWCNVPDGASMATVQTPEQQE